MQIGTIFTSAILGFSLAALTAGSASAGWRASHPRRTEVDARLDNQARRIHSERLSGDITAAQAHDLHQEDHGIRADERFDASQNGGHITKAEQHGLNQQENQVSQRIGH
jgi:hypothetical protein